MKQINLIPLFSILIKKLISNVHYLLEAKKYQRIIFIAFLLALTVSKTLAQQQYQPIPDSNASWIIQQNSPIQGQYFFYKFLLSPYMDDTVINSNIYTKIYFKFETNEPKYNGAFRNTTDGISYYVPSESEEEYLLRDFTKNAGDTIKNVAYALWEDLIWVLDFHVDSLEYVTSGQYTYKVMYLSTIIEDTIPDLYPYEPLVWMEKIGSFGGGILNSHIGTLSAKRLYCMQYNDTIYYDSFLWWFRTQDIVYDAGECDYPVGIGESKELKSTVNLFPNPFTSSATFEYSLSSAFQITLSIFNSFGVLVHQVQEHQQPGKQSVRWNAGDQPVGVYFYRLEAGEEVASGKLLLMR